MKTIDQLKEKHRQELAEFKFKEKLKKSLPIEPKSILLMQGKLFSWVNYSVESIDEFIKIFSAYTKILPIVYAKNSCAITSNINEYPEYSNYIIEGNYCLKIEVSQGKGFGPCVRFSFYSEINTNNCCINVDLKTDQYKYGARFTWTDSRANKVLSKHPSNLLKTHTDRVVRFYFGENSEPSADFVYLLKADDENCSVFTHAICMLETINNTR